MILVNFKSFLKKRGVSPLTQKNYLSDIRYFLRWTKRHSSQNWFSQAGIQSFKNSLIQAQIPISTVNRRLSSLRQFGDFLIEQGLIQKNHARQIIGAQIENNFQPILHQFQNELKSQKRKPATIKNYTSDISRYLSQDIQTDRLSQKTIKRKLASMKKFCQWAENSNLTNGALSAHDLQKMEGEKKLWGGIISLLIISLLVAILLTIRLSINAFLAGLPTPETPLPVSLPVKVNTISRKSFRDSVESLELTGSVDATGLQVTDQDKLNFPESLGIEAKEITIKTTDAYGGNITINPDNQGILNLLFEGQSPPVNEGFINIQNANLQNGNLIYAGIDNDESDYNFLQFQSGTGLSDRFTVTGTGNIIASGKLTLDSGQIDSKKNLIFSPQDQPTLTLAPKQSSLTGNLAISGQIYDGGLGIFGTTGEPLPQVFDFTRHLTIEFNFMTGENDLIIKFNLDENNDKHYQVYWKTNGQFALEACNPDCSPISAIADYPFVDNDWHHGRLYINDASLVWELDLSAQKVSAPVQIEDVPLLAQGKIQFSQNFTSIANLNITQGSNAILTSGHGQVGGNLTVSGALQLGQLSTIGASTHVCRNASGELAECSADYSEWYPVASNATKSSITGTLVSISNIPNPTPDETALFLAIPSTKAYDQNLLGVLANPDLGANGQKRNENYQPLVLTGRVPVKVSNLNGSIEIGDSISSSTINGVGMKASNPGVVIGLAMEPFNCQDNENQPITGEDLGKEVCQGKILAFINPGWYQPDSWTARQLDPQNQLSETSSSDSQDNDLTTEPFANETLNSLTVENLRTTGQEEVADRLLAQIQTQVADLEENDENTPLLSDDFIDPYLEQESTNSANLAGSEPATDSALLTQVDEFIQELEEMSISSITDGIENDISISNNDHFLSSVPSSLIDLTVTGSTSLGQTTIAGNLLVDSSLQFGANSINSLDNTLYFQDYGFGGIDFLAGKVKIDPQGNLAITGNVEIEKDLRVKQSLFASLLKPFEGDEIVVEGNFRANNATFDKIVIAANISTNASAGTTVLTANETELIITSDTITSQSLIYVTPLSATENKVLFVKTKVEKTECPEESEPVESLSDDSFLELILGINDSDETPDETPEEICLPQPGYFTVAIDKPIQQDIEFNWWVIN